MATPIAVGNSAEEEVNHMGLCVMTRASMILFLN